MRCFVEILQRIVAASARQKLDSKCDGSAVNATIKLAHLCLLWIEAQSAVIESETIASLARGFNHRLRKHL